MSSSVTIDKCAACGTEGGDSLKACTACHMVKYCNRDCQIAHRQQHKKECKKRAAEIYDEKLFKEVEPEECPICFQPLPLDARQTGFHPCCGKRICGGCVYAMLKSEGGSKQLCAYCRTPAADDDEESIERIKKLMASGNEYAYYHLAGGYMNINREWGLPQDYQRANEILLKAGELGCAEAYSNLAKSYFEGLGVEVDKKKAKHYFELSAMMGSVAARFNCGFIEFEAGNEDRAIKHFILAAKAGHDDALGFCKAGYRDGAITKDEYASTLRAYHERQTEMKSEMRDKAAASNFAT